MESNYEKLVKALTCGNDGKLPCHNNECPYWVDQWHGIGFCNVIKKDADAAAAIEELDAEETRLLLLTSDLQDKLMDLQAEVNRLELDNEDYEHENRRLHGEIEAWQAEVKRLKDSNEELRERQTYIDHYGDRWLTSAKDVPTAAYEHGYADGRDEAEAQLPKQRDLVEVVRCKDCYWNQTQRFGNGKEYCECSRGNSRINDGDWYCPEGEKMEVQDGD